MQISSNEEQFGKYIFPLDLPKHNNVSFQSEERIIRVLIVNIVYITDFMTYQYLKEKY